MTVGVSDFLVTYNQQQQLSLEQRNRDMASGSFVGIEEKEPEIISQEMNVSENPVPNRRLNNWADYLSYSCTGRQRWKLVLVRVGGRRRSS